MELKQSNELRTIRGYSILAKGVSPKVLDADTYLIPSQSSNKKYLVRNNGSGFTCECPDHTFRKLDCKHINAIRFWLKLKEKMAQQDKIEIKEELADRCVYCYSENIIKKDKRKTKAGIKQRFLCKDCGHKFVSDPIKKVKGNGKIITLVLDLYFKGVSLRKIKDHLQQFYDLDIDHSTIYRWTVRFTQVMNKYVEQFTPKVSDAWHIDEQMIKTNGKFAWSWNCIDEETRFLIANNITKERYVADARLIMQKAKETAKTNPEFIVTDGLHAYNKAFKMEFPAWWRKDTKINHIRLKDLETHPNNNIIERFHGTFRERDKTMRGFKGQEKIFAEGFRTYYNFIKQHQGLDGKTPSQVANIDLQLDRNRWLSLLKKSLS